MSLTKLKLDMHCHGLIISNLSEITCQHLRELSFGTVSPEVCTGGGEVPFGTTCKMTCNNGYTLDGPQTKQCTPDGIWSPVDKGEVSRCVGEFCGFFQIFYLFNIRALRNGVVIISWRDSQYTAVNNCKNISLTINTGLYLFSKYNWYRNMLMENSVRIELFLANESSRLVWKFLYILV